MATLFYKNCFDFLECNKKKIALKQNLFSVHLTRGVQSAVKLYDYLKIKADLISILRNES